MFLVYGLVGPNRTKPAREVWKEGGWVACFPVLVFADLRVERLEVTLFALQNVNKDITLKQCNNVLSSSQLTAGAPAIRPNKFSLCRWGGSLPQRKAI